MQTIKITPPTWQQLIALGRRSVNSPKFIMELLDELNRLARVADDEDPEYVIVKRVTNNEEQS